MHEITARTAGVQSVIGSAAATDPDMAQLSRSRPRPQARIGFLGALQGRGTGLVAWFGSTWHGGMRMTNDLGDNCEPGTGFMAAAASQVDPTSKMK